MKSWTIGRLPECDIVVDNDGVSGRHCRLTGRNGDYWLEDLNSTNGTFVNGSRVDGKVRVSPTDDVMLAGDVPLPWPGQKPEHGTVEQRVATLVPDAQSAPQIISIGRNPESDCVVDEEGVSWNHARLTVTGDKGLLEDLGSSNGTYVTALNNRIESVQITRDEVVFLGTHRVEAAKLFPTAADPAHQRQASAESLALTIEKPVVIGRDPSCDQVLDNPMVSWRHARITRHDAEFLIEDLGSSNGTFIGGRRITDRATARPGDVVSLGSYEIQLSDGGRVVTQDGRGRHSIEARDVVIDVPGKRLLDNVSLTIRPGEFVGLMGPSGAGKSTFMNALNGYVPPSGGTVLIGNRDLYQQYDLFRGQIGYVPQDDIMHGDLTVGQALYYTARLRLPSDFSKDEIQKRIREVLEQLALQGTEDVLIGSPEKKGISGGQRKRVNLAMELLTDPSILFLDEPTSGLSSQDALMVMKLLRSLADSGKTILLTIHQPSLEAFRQMDHLVLLGKDAGSADPGRLAYFGPSYPDAVDFFNPDGVPGQKPGVDPSPDEILAGLERKPAAEWCERYQKSAQAREFVDQRRSRASLPPATSKKKPANPIRVSETWTLFQRGVAIKLRDRANTALLMAQAPIIAILIVMVFGEDASQKVTDDNWPEVAKATSMSCFLLALSALWCGCSNSVREIVSEWAIYRRERMVNLSITSYIGAKLDVLLTLCAIQCFLLLTIVYPFNGLEGPWLGMFLVLLLVAAVGVGLGLLISAIARTSEFAVATLPVVILPMVMMGGALQPLEKMNDVVHFGSHFVPARWGFESLILLEADERPELTPPAMAVSQNGAADKDDDASEERDMAESFFPEGQHRTSVGTGVVITMIMLASLIGGVGLILRKRDIH